MMRGCQRRCCLRAEEEEAMPWDEEEAERPDIRGPAGNWTEGRLVQVMSG